VLNSIYIIQTVNECLMASGFERTCDLTPSKFIVFLLSLLTSVLMLGFKVPARLSPLAANERCMKPSSPTAGNLGSTSKDYQDAV
jgi:hypothetical protein